MTAVLFALCGCYGGRITKLERQVRRTQSAENFDLQGKCSSEAKTWYSDHWGNTRDKDTTLLDYTNHYNKAANKCYIEVEYHFRTPGGKTNDWTRDVVLYDVQENARYGMVLEDHDMELSTAEVKVSVNECDFQGKTCKTVDEWNSYAQPYMSK
jgi:hypothetical protein